MKESIGIIMFVFQFTTIVFTSGKTSLHIFQLVCHAYKMSSVYVLRLPVRHVLPIYPSVTTITSISLILFQCPYLANFRFYSVVQLAHSPPVPPIFCRTQTLVLYSVQLIRSTRLQDHNSNAVIRLFIALLHRPAFRSI